MYFLSQDIALLALFQNKGRGLGDSQKKKGRGIASFGFLEIIWGFLLGFLGGMHGNFQMKNYEVEGWTLLKRSKGRLSTNIPLLSTVFRKIIGDEQITIEGSITNINTSHTKFLGLKARNASKLSRSPIMFHLNGRNEMLASPSFFYDSVRFLRKQYPEC